MTLLVTAFPPTADVRPTLTSSDIIHVRGREASLRARLNWVRAIKTLASYFRPGEGKAGQVQLIFCFLQPDPGSCYHGDLERLRAFRPRPFTSQARLANHASGNFYVFRDHREKAAYVAALLARGRRANIVSLTVLILLLLFNYWDNGAIPQFLDRTYGAL